MKSDGNGNIEDEEKSDKPVPFYLPLPPHLDLLLDRPVASRQVQLQHAWNPNDRSLNIFVKEDDEFTFHRYIYILREHVKWSSIIPDTKTIFRSNIYI